MNGEITSLLIEVEMGVYRECYRTLPVKPRDLKALAAMLSAFADAPETVDMHIGPIRIQIKVVDEV